MICGAALARRTPTVSTKSFETSSQMLNNSGISAHPTLRTIKKVNRMEALFTDCLSLGSFRSQCCTVAAEIESPTSTTGNLPCQHERYPVLYLPVSGTADRSRLGKRSNHESLIMLALLSSRAISLKKVRLVKKRPWL